MPFSGSRRLRNCASVKVPNTSTPLCSSDVISIIAIGTNNFFDHKITKYVHLCAKNIVFFGKFDKILYLYALF